MSGAALLRRIFALFVMSLVYVGIFWGIPLAMASDGNPYYANVFCLHILVFGFVGIVNLIGWAVREIFG